MMPINKMLMDTPNAFWRGLFGVLYGDPTRDGFFVSRLQNAPRSTEEERDIDVALHRFAAEARRRVVAP